MKKDLVYRQKYLETVRPFMGKRLIKVFTGQRRVGKSYLLFQIMQEIQTADENAHIIYINKEDLAFSHITTAENLNDFVQEQKKSGQKNYIFIDEIQEITDFEQALRSLLLDDELDLYCTGSNAHLLSRDIAGSLSGRAIEINVHSLSYFEFLEFMKLDDSDKSMSLFLKYGGLPYLKDLPLQDNIVFEYLRNIYSTIAIRDIVNRYALRNVQFLEQLTQFLASNIGNLFSAKKISDFLKSQKITTSSTQVQNYAEYLANAFLIHKVPRYDIEGKRIFEIGEKYYFEDLGLRNALIGYRVQDRGKLLENCIFNHLQIAGYDVKIGGLNSQEIDFVAEKNGERIYVQATLTINEEKTLEREFGNLLKIQDNYPKYVVTMNEFEGNTFEGVQCLSLRRFLKEILGQM
ncbi:ATP-binding protein [Glaesserella parasuis]|uniref:ATP-binding protein n=1 Tax=Glaesserella parasuis TaxID=738 RepID=UPI0021C1E7AD|nr:ATP-binding protein [Glaesserella parasuis]MCT8535144.1 ATP-binding protein [Glaesserella parasuis]MCT8747079.1 ATP-binding protein [Glaesserella parasuis]MCT8748968.1 ATP-binding protein [Glaesserella parasuis]MCT8772176.1 ATP-binding protein [Glaesserella parasuis]MCT8778365.1 ATP-binding protein [Glaesserella parasuis]